MTAATETKTLPRLKQTIAQSQQAVAASIIHAVTASRPPNGTNSSPGSPAMNSSCSANPSIAHASPRVQVVKGE